MSRNLLLGGGPGHEFDRTSALLVDLLAEQGFRTTTTGWPAEAAARLRAAASGAEEPYSLFTVNALRWRMEDPRYASQRARHAVDVDRDDLRAFDSFVRDGGGLLALHAAVICFDGAPLWRDLCGASWRWGSSDHPRLGPVSVAVTPAGRTHEVTGGTEDFEVEDELYRGLDGVDGVVPLLVGAADGQTAPVLWARDVGAGRVVTDLLGHGPASLQHPGHRAVLGRSARWAAGRHADATTTGGGPR